MRVVDEIVEKLSVFEAEELLVEDDSARHAGHSGASPEGQTHFRVRMRAARLAPLSRIERHRAVHAALGPDLAGRIHALALDLNA